MTELRFSAQLYSGDSVDEAVKIYADFGRYELEKTTTDYVVRVYADDETEEARLADELANYALGLTIERSRVGSSSAQDPA